MTTQHLNREVEAAVAEKRMSFLEIAAKLERYSGIKPAPLCWLGGRDVDQGPSYCPECAEEKVAQGKAEFVDGGWTSSGEDHCSHCDNCGCELDYNLTREGVSSELDHFQRRRFSRPLNRHMAFHIARVIDAEPADPAVQKLALRAFNAMPPANTDNQGDGA